MPTYISQDDIQARVGGEDALKLIADPTFTASTIDVDVVESAIDWAEGEVLERCRGIDASGIGSWENTPASIVKPAKDLMLTLAVYGIHERIRAAQGVAIPRDVIASKDRAYKTLEALEEARISWVSSEVPGKQATQAVRVFVDDTGRGRQARTYQTRKLVR